jgi:hypothetical protein
VHENGSVHDPGRCPGLATAGAFSAEGFAGISNSQCRVRQLLHLRVPHPCAFCKGECCGYIYAAIEILRLRECGSLRFSISNDSLKRNTRTNNMAKSCGAEGARGD